jgi:hypothetical protein
MAAARVRLGGLNGRGKHGGRRRRREEKGIFQVARGGTRQSRGRFFLDAQQNIFGATDFWAYVVA